MNQDRRHLAKVCIALVKECSDIGEMSNESHDVLSDSLKQLTSAEYWQLRNQERHEGKNAATDKQIAICRVALPALEQAVKALKASDYNKVIARLQKAVDTDGTAPRKRG